MFVWRGIWYGTTTTGSGNGEQPVLGIRVHVISGARHVHIAREHGSAGKGGRGPTAGAAVWDHRVRREAPRERVLQNSPEASGSGPHGRHDGDCGHDAQEDHDAGAPDVRWARPQAIRALLRRGSAARDLHG